MFGSSPTRRLRLHFSPSQRPLACVPVSSFQFQIFSSSPRRCPTRVVRVAGEMITHILRLIESAIRLIHPQNRLQPVFVKQSEFVFCKRDQ